MNWIRLNLNAILSILTSVFIGLILILLVNQSQATNKLAQNTNSIVKSQGDILQAIKDLASDTKITAEQKTNIIICMLQVPIEQRSTDTLTNCRKQAEATSSPSITQPTTVPQPAVSQPVTQTAQPVTPQNPAPTNPVVNLVNNLLKRIGL